MKLSGRSKGVVPTRLQSELQRLALQVGSVLARYSFHTEAYRGFSQCKFTRDFSEITRKGLHQMPEWSIIEYLLLFSCVLIKARGSKND